MGNTPIVSIVIPLYNKQDTIANTLQSILSINGIDYEIIVVDDGSTDKSVCVVNSFESDRIHVFRKMNGGPSSARNYGVENANGDWIYFLDADDMIIADSFQKILPLLHAVKESVVSCNFYVKAFDKQFVYSKNRYNGEITNNYYSYYTGKIALRAGSAFIRREIAQQYPFNEQLRRYEDLEVIFRIMEKERIYRTNTPILIYDRDVSSASKPCKDVSLDYIGHLDINKSSFFYRLMVYELFVEGKLIYGESCSSLYNTNDYKKIKYFIVSKAFRALKKMRLL